MQTREIQGGVQAARALINKSIIIILKSKIKKQMERDLLSPESLDTLLSPEGLTSLLSEVCTVLTLFTVSCNFQCLILNLLVHIKYYLTWASPCSSDLYSHYAPVKGGLEHIYIDFYCVTDRCKRPSWGGHWPPPDFRGGVFSTIPSTV